MATIGSMIVNVLANTAGFVSGMKTVRSELQLSRAEAAKATAALIGVGNVKNVLGGLAIGVSGAAITRTLMNTADEIDRLVKVSDRLGITTENLRGLEFGAALAGVSAEDLGSALGFMSKQLAEAAHGGGKAKDVIKELGLDAKRLATMTPDEALLTFTRALAGVKDESEKVRIAMRVFGNAGQPLLTLLNEGEDAIRGYVEEAKKLGLTYSKEEADKVVAFNDAWEQLGITLGGFTKDIVIDVSPEAIKIVQDLQAIAGRTNNPRTSADKPQRAGSWLPDWMQDPLGLEDWLARNTYSRLAQKKKDSGRSFTDSPQFNNSMERQRFTQGEIEQKRKASQWYKDPRFRPPDDPMRERYELGRMVRPLTRRITGPAEIGINVISKGLANVGKAANGLAALEKRGVEWAKQDMIRRIVRPPQDPFYNEKIRAAKEAAEKAKQEAEDKVKRDAETRRRMTQPVPTAAPGTAASREQIRQSQQQAAQLKEARNANLHLRGIKDALTNPRATGL